MLQSSLFKSTFKTAALKASGGLDLSAAYMHQFSPGGYKTEIGTKELYRTWCCVILGQKCYRKSIWEGNKRAPCVLSVSPSPWHPAGNSSVCVCP